MNITAHIKTNAIEKRENLSQELQSVVPEGAIYFE